MVSRHHGARPEGKGGMTPHHRMAAWSGGAGERERERIIGNQQHNTHWPRLVRWRPKDLKGPPDLLELVTPVQKDAPQKEFDHDTADCPNIDTRVVSRRAEEKLWRAVPKRELCGFLRALGVILAHRHAKVRQFQLSPAAQQQVVRLQILCAPTK